MSALENSIPRAPRLLLLAALAALLIHVAHTMSDVGGAGAHPLVDDWLYTSVLAGSALLCIARGIRGPGERAAWR